jgi:hypothetical protein
MKPAPAGPIHLVARFAPEWNSLHANKLSPSTFWKLPAGSGRSILPVIQAPVWAAKRRWNNRSSSGASPTGRDAAVFDGRGNARLAKTIDEADDPPILGFARGTLFVESLIKDGGQRSGSDIRIMPAAAAFTNARTKGTLVKHW